MHGQKVILADDLARLYGVPSKRLNEQAKLRSRSQIATLKRGRNIKHFPSASTENGVIMSPNIALAEDMRSD